MTSLTFAIGDIHGCYDQLVELVDKCNAYDPTCKHRKLVFLGDYIDRGPKSKQVIEYLKTLPQERVCLKGNHEDMAIGQSPNYAHGFENGYYNWMGGGGDKTEASYPEGKMSEEHKEWIRNLPLHYQDKHRIFVHAGLNPYVDKLIDQRPFDLTWIRNEFLYSDKDFGKLVIHGHTPYNYGDGRLQIKPNRINLDTACAYGGCLTAGVFNDESRDIIHWIQVDGPKK